MAKPTTDTGKPAEKKSPIELLKDSWFVIGVVFAIGTALGGGYIHLVTTYAKMDDLNREKSALSQQICELHYSLQKRQAEQESKTAEKRAENLSLELPPEENTTPTALRLRNTLTREIFNANVSGCSYRKRFVCLDKLYNGCESDSAFRPDACPLLEFKDECQ